MAQGIPLVKVSLQVHEDVMLLDHNTVQTLELIENAKTGHQRGGSLFAAVNNTKTAMGSRLMRSSLLQPLKNPGMIHARLDAVDRLVSSPDLFSGLVQALESFPDLERVSSALLIKSASELQFSAIGPINPATIVLLMHLDSALTKISAVVRVLEEHCGESTLLQTILEALNPRACEDKDEVATSAKSLNSSEHGTRGESTLQRIRSAISTKLTSGENIKSRAPEQIRLQAVNLIKPGVDGMQLYLLRLC